MSKEPSKSPSNSCLAYVCESDLNGMVTDIVQDIADRVEDLENERETLHSQIETLQSDVPLFFLCQPKEILFNTSHGSLGSPHRGPLNPGFSTDIDYMF